MFKIMICSIILLFLAYMVMTIYEEITKKTVQDKCKDDLCRRIDEENARRDKVSPSVKLARHYASVWVCRSCGREHKTYETSCFCGMEKSDSADGNWSCRYCGWKNLGTGFFANATCENCGSLWLSSLEDSKAAILSKYYCKPLSEKTDKVNASGNEANLIPAPGKYGSEGISDIKSGETPDNADLETDEFVNSISADEEKRIKELEEAEALEASLQFI